MSADIDRDDNPFPLPIKTDRDRVRDMRRRRVHPKAPEQVETLFDVEPDVPRRLVDVPDWPNFRDGSDGVA